MRKFVILMKQEREIPCNILFHILKFAIGTEIKLIKIQFGRYEFLDEHFLSDMFMSFIRSCNASD